MQNVMIDFQFKKSMMRYSKFVPQFYNLCKSYGFKPGRIMPSRAFCSDESQGFPIILIAKHFFSQNFCEVSLTHTGRS